MQRGCGEALGFAFGVPFASKRGPANPRIRSVRNSVWESWAGKVMVPSWACTVILFEKLVMDVAARGAGCGAQDRWGGSSCLYCMSSHSAVCMHYYLTNKSSGFEVKNML